MTSPCTGKAKCPFRKDCLKGWLGKERATEIIQSLSFTCHKEDKAKQCAGHILVSGFNKFKVLAEIFGIVLTINNADKVFKTEQDFINHHNKQT